MIKLNYRCQGNYCLQATRCRRYMPDAKDCPLPFAAFDMRDTVDCDGFLPRIMVPILVEPLPPGFEVVADNIVPSSGPGAWTCKTCGFRGFWSGGPHCIQTPGAGRAAQGMPSNAVAHREAACGRSGGAEC